MTRVTLITFFSIVAATLQGSILTAQTVAIGTATAEIVEAVSLSSSIVSDFSIPADVNNIENLSLGRININSGKDVECNIIIKSDDVSNERGGKISVEPALNNKYKNQSVSGNISLSLIGKALYDKEMDRGSFKASYAIILAYN